MVSVPVAAYLVSALANLRLVDCSGISVLLEVSELGILEFFGPLGVQSFLGSFWP